MLKIRFGHEDHWTEAFSFPSEVALLITYDTIKSVPGVEEFANAGIAGSWKLADDPPSQLVPEQRVEWKKASINVWHDVVAWTIGREEDRRPSQRRRDDREVTEDPDPEAILGGEL